MKQYLTSKKIISGACVVAGVALPGVLSAQVNLLASDGFGGSSFSSAGNWSNAAAPTAGNDYVVTDLLFRTPTPGGDVVFQGGSLTINSSVYGDLNRAFMFKGTGYTATVNNMTLNGGNLRAAEGSSQIFRLDGNLTITATGGTMHTQGGLVVDSAISGSGPLRIEDSGNTDALRVVTFTSGANTFNGNLILNGSASDRARFDLAPTGLLNFDIGAPGVNNSVFGTGTATFSGVFLFDLAAASSTPGDSWTIASVSNQSFGNTFSVGGGFIDNGDGTWTSGLYQFSELTGALEVIPEPSTYAVIFGSLVLAGALLRRRRL